MNRVATLHANLLFTIILVFGTLALWGLIGALRKQPITPAYRSVLVIGELLVVAECLLGLGLIAAGRTAYRPEIHLIYGVVAVATLPVILLFNRSRIDSGARMNVAVACGFVCLIVLRALETGRIPG